MATLGKQALNVRLATIPFGVWCILFNATASMGGW